MKTSIVLIIVAFVLAGACGATEIDSQAIDFYLKGLFLEARYDLVHAFSFYSYADRYEPNNGRIKLRLAWVTLKMGELDKARQYADQLIEMREFETDAYMVLAEVEYKQGNNAAALERLMRVEKRDDAPRFEVLKSLAKVYLELGKVGDARKVLEEAHSIFSGDLFVEYRLGFIYMDAGETEKAIEAFEAVIEINPGLANVHLALASLLRRSGREEEAKRSYLAALELEPTNRTAFKELMDLVLESGDFEGGIAFLEPLYNEDRLEEGGVITLGNLYYRAGRTEDALRLFRKLVERKGERPLLLRLIADIEMERGNLKTSYTYLRKLTEAEPDTFSNYIGLLFLSGDLAGEPSGPHEELHMSGEEVQQCFEKAIETMDAESARDNYLLGLLYRRHGNLDDAEVYLLEAERLAPGERKTAMELASMYEDRGEYDEALERITAQYEDNPGDASLMNFYGYLLAEKESELDKAENLLREALSQEPENGYFLDSLGWIKFKQKEYEQALEILIRAIELVGDDAVIWEHLGDTYRKLDRSGEAMDAYRKSLEIDPTQDNVREKVHGIQGGNELPEK